MPVWHNTNTTRYNGGKNTEWFELYWLAFIDRRFTRKHDGATDAIFPNCVGIRFEKHFKHWLSTEHEVLFCTSLCKHPTDEVTIRIVYLSDRINSSCCSNSILWREPAHRQQELQKRQLIRQFRLIFLFRFRSFNLFAAHLFIVDRNQSTFST